VAIDAVAVAVAAVVEVTGPVVAVNRINLAPATESGQAYQILGNLHPMSLTHLTRKVFLPSLGKHHFLIFLLVSLRFDTTQFLWCELGHLVILMMRIVDS
jgi:hypothetical protein